eukprot:534574-Hanusia_phi.AAC.6
MPKKEISLTEKERKTLLIDYATRFNEMGFKVVPLELTPDLYDNLTAPYDDKERCKKIYKGTEGMGYKKALMDISDLHNVSRMGWNKPIDYTIDIIRNKNISGLAVEGGSSLRIDDDTYKGEVSSEVKEMMKELEREAQVVIMSGDGKHYFFKEMEFERKKLCNNMIEILNGISYVNEYPYHNPKVIFRSKELTDVPERFIEYYKTETTKYSKKLKKYKPLAGVSEINIKKFEEISLWNITNEHVTEVINNLDESFRVGKRWFLPHQCLLGGVCQDDEHLKKTLDDWSKIPTSEHMLCQINKEYDWEKNNKKWKMIVRKKSLHKYPNILIKACNETNTEVQMKNFPKVMTNVKYIDLHKYGDKVKSVHRYMEPDELKGDNDVFIVSGLGTGKTSSVLDYLKSSKEPFIFVVHLKNLIWDINHNLKQKGLKVRTYEANNIENEYNKDNKKGEKTNWILSYNSLHKFVEEIECEEEDDNKKIMTSKSFEDYTIILDEFKSSREYLFTANTFKNTRKHCIVTLDNMFKTAKKMILMDGNMLDDDIDYYKMSRKEGMDYKILTTKFKKFDKVEAIQVSEYDEMKKRIINESIWSKFGTYVCCNTRDIMSDLQNEIRGHIKKTISDDNPEFTEKDRRKLVQIHEVNKVEVMDKYDLRGLKNIDKLQKYLCERIMYIGSDTDRSRWEYSGNVNQKWKRKIIITSPCIIEGVNYEPEGPINTYCITSFARTLTSDQKVQQLCRNRNCATLFYYINHKINPERIIMTGMPVHSCLDDCRKYYNNAFFGGHMPNKITSKSKEMGEINEELKNRNMDDFTTCDSRFNKVLMNILYRQDVQMLNYEYYYVKNLKRLGFYVYQSYRKESKKTFNGGDVLEFLKSRDIMMKKELEEFEIYEDDSKFYEKVGELVLKDKKEKVEDLFETIHNRDERPNEELPREEEWNNRKKYYFKRVPHNLMDEYAIKYKDILMNGLSCKVDMEKPATKEKDVVLEHNKVVAFMMNQKHLEGMLETTMTEDSPLMAYKSCYQEMWKTKKILKDYLGVENVNEFEYMDTGKIEETIIKIKEDDAKNYFNMYEIEDTKENKKKLEMIEEYNRAIERGEKPKVRRPRNVTRVPAKEISKKKMIEVIKKKLEGIWISKK